MPRHSPARASAWGLAAALVLFLSLGLRGLDWGLVEAPSGAVFLLQPDEDVNLAAARRLADGKVPTDAPSPQHLKGLFFYTQLRSLAAALGGLWAPDSLAFYRAARVFVLLQGAACVALTWLLGRLAGGPAVAALAALFLAASPALVVHARYLTPDVPSLLWALAALLAACRGPKSPREALLLGALAGAAAAAKHHAALLVVPAAWALRGRPARDWAAALGGFALALAVLDPVLWREPGLVLRGARMLAENNRDGVPYHLARLPGWLDYPLTVLPYALGSPLALASLPGIWLLGRSREGRPLLAWLAAVWLATGFDNVRLVRYCLPALPVLCLAAAVLVRRVWAARGGRPAAAALAALCMAAALHHSLAYAGAMGRPDPRLKAFLWFMEEVPPPARIAVPKADFSRVPTPPGGSVVEVGHDWDALQRSGADWFVHSDYDWLEYLEAEPFWPREASFIRRLEAGGDWVRVRSFDNPPSAFGLPLRAEHPPHDWLYPVASLTVYRRASRAP